MRNLIEVTVPYYIPIALVAALLGLAASGGSLTMDVLPAAISLAALVGGFNTLNGITDLRIDRINKPGRPIPAGVLSRRTAAIWAVILYAVAFVAGITVSPLFFYILVVSAAVTAAYSLPPIRLRRHFIGANTSGTLLYGILCPLAGWAIFPYNPIPLTILPFTGLLTLSLSVTKDLEDIVGDKAYGIMTLPVAIGVKNSAKLTAIGVVMAFGYLAAATFVGLLATQFAIILIILPVMLLLIREVWTRGSDHHIHRGLAKRIFLALIALGIVAELALAIIALM